MQPWVLHADCRTDWRTDWYGRVLTWLRDNEVITDHLIPEDATLLVAEGYLSTEEFLVDDKGKPVLDETGEEILRRKFTARLITAPPDLPEYVVARAAHADSAA